MKSLTRGQLGRMAGVNIETLRYYERRKLIPDPPRSASGYRMYSEDSVYRVMFIKRAQSLGFTLREISELLSLRADPKTSCCEVKKKAKEKIGDIEGKIKTLKKIKKALGTLIISCDKKGSVTGCPILQSMDKNEILYKERR